MFEEKFQINTLLELDPDTGRPLKEKISKMTVVLDKSMGETPLAEVEFNMADFNYGEYKPVKLYLKKCAENDYVDIDDDIAVPALDRADGFAIAVELAGILRAVKGVYGRAHPSVKTLVTWPRFIASVFLQGREVPLAPEAGFIALALQDLRDGDFLIMEVGAATADVEEATAIRIATGQEG